MGVRLPDMQVLSIYNVASKTRQDLLRYEGTIAFVVDPTGQRIAYQIEPGGGGGASPALNPRGPLNQQAPTTTLPIAPIGRLSVYDRAGGGNRPIIEASALAFSWSPASNRLAYLQQAGSGLVQWRFWSDRGTVITSLPFAPSPAVQEQYATYFQQDQSLRWWSPDGQAFAFAGRCVRKQRRRLRPTAR